MSFYLEPTYPAGGFMWQFRKKSRKKAFRCFKREETPCNFTNLGVNLKKTLKNKPTYKRPKRGD